jgi:hypothetical protein
LVAFGLHRRAALGCLSLLLACIWPVFVWYFAGISPALGLHFACICLRLACIRLAFGMHPSFIRLTSTGSISLHLACVWPAFGLPLAYIGPSLTGCTMSAFGLLFAFM